MKQPTNVFSKNHTSRNWKYLKMTEIKMPVLPHQINLHFRMTSTSVKLLILYVLS
jgi:hypothetical protein